MTLKNKMIIKELGHETVYIGSVECFEEQGLNMKLFARKTSEAIQCIVAESTPTLLPKSYEEQKKAYKNSVVAIRTGNEPLEERIIGAYSFKEKKFQDIGIENSVLSPDIDMLYFTGLYVDAEGKYRGKGIGDALVKTLSMVIDEKFFGKEYVTFLEILTPNTAAVHLHPSQGFVVVDYPTKDEIEATSQAVQTVGWTKENLYIALVCMAKPSQSMDQKKAHAILTVLQNGYKTLSERYYEIVAVSKYLRNQKKNNVPFELLDPEKIALYKKHEKYFQIPQFKGNFHHYSELLDHTDIALPPGL